MAKPNQSPQSIATTGQPQTSAITYAQQAGSYVLTTHTAREMKLYGVYESELTTLSILNGITGLFASLGTGLAAFAAGQLIDLAKAPGASNPTMVNTVCWISGIVAVACYGVAGAAFFLRHSAVSKIKKESRPVP